MTHWCPDYDYTADPPCPHLTDPIDRDTAIALIRAALRRRTGKAWSVTGGRGTSWGWIPAGHDYRVEYVDRAAGRAPSRTGTPYWD